MTLMSSVKDLTSTIVSLPNEIWKPYRPNHIGPSANTSVIKSFCWISAKFLGRTLTLAMAAGITFIALNALAKTAIGSLVGVTVIVAAVNPLPLAFTITVAITIILGTGFLSSVLIEVYS